MTIPEIIIVIGIAATVGLVVAAYYKGKP